MTTRARAAGGWQWTIQRMIEWFRTGGIYDADRFTGNDPTVLVWTFSKTNNWKKYDKKVHTLRYCRDLVQRWPGQYPHGLYVVPYYMPNWFLVVKPERRDGSQHLFADHYSFVLDKNKPDRVNAHYTTYHPAPRGDGGKCTHDFSYFTQPVAMPMTPAAAEAELFRGFAEYGDAPALLALMDYAAPPIPRKRRGGTPTVTVTETPPEVAMPEVAMPAKTFVLAKNLADIWDAGRLDHIRIIGVRGATSIYFTAIPVDRHTWPEDVSFRRPAFHFSLPNSAGAFEHQIVAEIRAWLRQDRVVRDDPMAVAAALSEAEEAYAAAAATSDRGGGSVARRVVWS